jgi:hypothetical protein
VLGELGAVALSAWCLWSGLDQDVLAFTFSRRGSTLSVASVVTLSAYVALLTIGGRDANLPWGLLVALGGSQDMVQGVVVILVLALAGRDAIRTRAPQKVEIAR